MRHSRTNATSVLVIVASFGSSPGTPGLRRPRSGSLRSPHDCVSGGQPARASGGRWARPSDAGLGSRLRATEPFVETDVAEARFAERDERALLDAAAKVSRLGITHDLARVADRLQIAGDDFVERCSFRA